MFMRTILFFAGVLLSFPLADIASGEEPPDLNWSSRVRTYGSNAGGVVGVYRTLGPQWDLGLQTIVSVNHDETEVDEDRSESMDRTGLAVSLYPELRRRTDRSGAVSTYWGIQGRYSYSHDHRTTELGDPVSRSRNDDWRTTLGVAGTVGAAVRVHRHLGVSADITPLVLDYSWTKAESEYTRDDIEETREQKGNTLGLNVAVSPALYVVVYF